jgi:hypothetical protein
MCMCCVPTKHAVLSNKDKYWLARTNGGLLTKYKTNIIISISYPENYPDMIYIVNDCRLAPTQQCFSYITARAS